MHTSPLDPDALLNEHARSIRRLARAIVADQDLADDVAQDATLVALRRPPPAGKSAGAWVAGIVRNVGRNTRRAASRRRDHERGSAAQREPGLSPVNHLERIELQRALMDAVAALPESQRATISLHYFSGLTIDEVAEHLHISRETVRTRVRTGLRRLRAQLQGSQQRPSARWGALLSLAGAQTASRVLGVALVKQVAVVSLLILGIGGLCWWAFGPSVEESGVEAGATDVALQNAGPVLQGVTPLPEIRSPEPLDSSSTRLSGRVLAADGDEPIAGARVAIYDATTTTVHAVDAKPLAVSRTGKDGTFAVDVLSDRAMFSVNVSHAGHSPGSTWIARDGAGTIWLDQPRHLHGQVVDERGRPVSQARVRWLSVLGSVQHVVSAVTNDAGRFAFDAPRHRRFMDSLGVALDVTADGFAPHRVPLSRVMHDRAIQILLARGATVRGRVLNAESGEPLAGAQVFLWAVSELVGFNAFDGRSLGNPAHARPLGSVRTRSDGSFVFSHVPAWTGQQVGVHTAASMVRNLGFLGVAHPDHVTKTVPIQVPENDAVVDLAVRMERATVATGRVVHATGAPYVGARVEWFRTGGPVVQVFETLFATAPRHAAITDEVGHYRLERVAVSAGHKPLVVRATPPGRFGWTQSATVHVATQSIGANVPDITLTGRLDRPFADIQVVNTEGIVIPHAFVKGGALGAQHRADDVLRVLASLRESQTATIEVHAHGYLTRSVALTLAHAPTDVVHVVLGRSAAPIEPPQALPESEQPRVQLVGTLRDADTSEPVLKYVAHLRSDHASTIHRSVFAGAGRYAFQQVTDGDWQLTIAAPGYEGVTRTVRIDSEESAAQLDLQLHRGLALRVRVRDPKNAMIDGATLSFRQGRKYTEAVLDGLGNATLRGLRSGVSAGVTAYRKDARGQAQWFVLHPFRPTLMMPAANSGVMDLTMQQAGVATIRVHGTILGYDQASATLAQQAVRKATTAALENESGNVVWERTNLRGSGWSLFAPPGRYVLRVNVPRAAAFEKSIDLTTVANQVIDVTIE